MQEQLTQFEEIQKDWEMEKEALEQVVMAVRGQLKQKEQALKELQENQVNKFKKTRKSTLYHRKRQHMLKSPVKKKYIYRVILTGYKIIL